MLRGFLISISLIVISISAFADECAINSNLLNKICSKEFYEARSSRDLNDYLANGKYKSGKLLNLSINTNISDNEISIATPCDVKVAKLRSIKATLNGVCIRGSSVKLEGLNSITAEKKAPINIIAEKSVLVRLSTIESTGDINISTSKFLPLDGEVLITLGSILKAKNITVNSKSNLTINALSRLNSSNNILNGGNCEVNDRNDSEADDREWDRGCRKFSPAISYTGTCATNPLPVSLRISTMASISDSKNLTMNVVGAPLSSQINWKINKELDNNGQSALQSFQYPGRHLVQAAVVGNNGYFRKLGSFINVFPSRFNNKQYGSFYFFGTSSFPKKINGTFDNKNLVFQKSEDNGEVYIAGITSKTSGLKNLNIPIMGYQTKFNLKILPSIPNPESYFEENLNEAIEMAANLNSDLEFKTYIDAIASIARSEFAKLSKINKADVADRLQANKVVISSETTSIQYKGFNPLNLLMDTAQAGIDEDIEKFIDKDIMGLLGQPIVGAAGIGTGVVVVGAALLIIKLYPNERERAYAFGILGTTLAAMWYAKENSEKVIKGIKGFLEFGKSLLIKDAKSGEDFQLELNGRFRQIISADENSKSDDIKKIVKNVNEKNLYFGQVNAILLLGNEWITKNAIPAPQFNLIEFDKGIISGNLSAEFITKVEVVSTEIAGTKVNYYKNGDLLILNVTSAATQTVRVRLTYVNDVLGAEDVVDMDIRVIVKPMAIIYYTLNQLTVNFVSSGNEGNSGLSYLWMFGDGNTSTDISPIHTYSQSGKYMITLLVTDSYGYSNSTSSEIQLQGATAPYKFCNIGLLTSIMNFKIDGHESFSLGYTTAKNQTDPVECECRTLQLPVNRNVNYTISGTAGQNNIMIPAVGAIYVYPYEWAFENVFSTGAYWNGNKVDFEVIRGVWGVNRCTSYIEK